MYIIHIYEGTLVHSMHIGPRARALKAHGRNSGDEALLCTPNLISHLPQDASENATTEQVKMIEVKLSQGAKPAHGGVLPAAKITAAIAEARGGDS